MTTLMLVAIVDEIASCSENICSKFAIETFAEWDLYSSQPTHQDISSRWRECSVGDPSLLTIVTSDA